MTTSLLERTDTTVPHPPCPAWCTNYRHPRAAKSDMCDAGFGDRWHTGRIGGVVLPSRVDEYYDEEIGVELFRTVEADGTVSQMSVLIIYACEMQEIGHVALDIADARRLVTVIRTSAVPGSSQKSRQVRFGDQADNNILAQHPVGYLTCPFVMTVEGRRKRMNLHRTQIECLGDLVASACVLAEVA